jgi:hypothetical protein
MIHMIKHEVLQAIRTSDNLGIQTRYGWLKKREWSSVSFHFISIGPFGLVSSSNIALPERAMLAGREGAHNAVQDSAIME